ncbi:hypothetical protein DFQ26_006270 [Actinomortierella ambigua]|nr:hypothetical protein DFQ26_006270 [Actinomortierella ambigua]
MNTPDLWYPTATENDSWWSGYTVWRTIVGITVGLFILLFICAWYRRRRLQKWRRQNAIDPELVDNAPPPLYSYYPPQPQPMMTQSSPPLTGLHPPAAAHLPPGPPAPMVMIPSLLPQSTWATAAGAGGGGGGEGSSMPPPPRQYNPWAASSTPSLNSFTGIATAVPPPPPYESGKK